MSGAEEIVYAVRGLYADGHYYASFGHWSLDPERMMYASGGAKLCKLNLRTRRSTVLLADPQGSVRDPQVHYDGRKIVFSYRPGGTQHFHLYEIGADGRGLRQLTEGPFDDIEPAYLPDGGIVFPSSRCKRFIACWYTPAATLFRIDGDGKNLRGLSSNIVHENTPAVLPDGRILFTRWEYVDRAPQKFHGLWTMHPDGTEQQIAFGNTQPPGEWVLMIDAKPIPGTDRVVAVFSPGHGNREHAGEIRVVDLRAGPDDPGRARRISPTVPLSNGWMGGRDGFHDPYPLGPHLFLVARDKSLLLLDDQEHTVEICRAAEMVARAFADPAAAARAAAPAARRPGPNDRPTSAHRRMPGPEHAGRAAGRDPPPAGARAVAQAGEFQRRAAEPEPERHLYAEADPGHGAGRARRVGLLHDPRAAEHLLCGARRAGARSAACRAS